jgi:D-3-phosphoglycerate dehydrogenase
VLRDSNYLTLHAPFNDATRLMIRDETIAQREPNLPEQYGAGLDVFMSESDASYRRVTEELSALPNVIAWPPAALTRETRLGGGCR